MTDAPSYNPAHTHELHPPRAMLMALGALVLLALIGVGFTRLGGFIHTTDWRSLSVEALPIIVEDGADGSVIVRDPLSGALMREWGPDTGGFVRTAMRSLALERRQLAITLGNGLDYASVFGDGTAWALVVAALITVHAQQVIELVTQQSDELAITTRFDDPVVKIKITVLMEV